MITGEIVLVNPQSFLPGQEMRFTVAYTAHNPGATVWYTLLSATLDTFSDKDANKHLGSDGDRDDVNLNLGVMPNRTISGYIKLEARNLWAPWITLDQRFITIEILSPGSTEPLPSKVIYPKTYDVFDPALDLITPMVTGEADKAEEEKKEVGWVTWLVLGLGAAAVAVAAFVWRK